MHYYLVATAVKNVGNEDELYDASLTNFLLVKGRSEEDAVEAYEKLFNHHAGVCVAMLDEASDTILIKNASYYFDTY